MNHVRRAAGPLVLAVLLLTTTAIRAERCPTMIVASQPQPAEHPVAVPVTTNGWSNINITPFVSYQIYATPVVNDVRNPGARPVYNLPFYGGTRMIGWQDGAVSRPKGVVPY